jgi:hypothetical protein
MTTEQIMALQRKVGTAPDGIWGQKSKMACRAYLRGLMPKGNDAPSSSEEAMVAYYGQPGDAKNLVSINVAHLGIRYEGAEIQTIRCHKRAAASLLAALTEVSKGPAAWVLKEYAGCFNNRPMRNGKRKSKHAWGVAIDLAPGTNGLRDSWPEESSMPIEVMEAFARNGWISGGAEWGFDAMHFERTS